MEYLFFHAMQRMPSGANPDAGTTMAAMCGALANEGQPLELDWPYLPAQPAPSAWAVPAISSPCWKVVADATSKTFDEVVSELDANRPVVLGLIITSSFFHCDGTGCLPALKSDPERTGHAVLAVGHGTDTTGEAHVLVRNTWGSSWGAAGHAWLSRTYIERQLRETAVIP